MTFDDWWAEYLANGGKTHFNIMANEESARVAWEAACEASAKKVEGNYGWINGEYFDDLGDALRTNK